MGELGLYVVRVYRRDASGMAGVVESVKSGERLAFHTTEELWHALYDLPSARRNLIDREPIKGDPK